MNVGLVVPGFSANPADWCIPALRHLARTLAATDHVRVIAVRYPYTQSRYAIDGAEVIALGGAVRRGASTVNLWRQALALVGVEHRGRPFDVLHAFWATESGLLASLAGRLLGIPTLVSLAGGELVALHDIGYGDQRLAWERVKVRASLRLSSAVTVGSRTLLSLASQHVSAHRLHRAPLGVDTTLFSPQDHSRGENRVVHVGTLTRVKDQATLLRAFAHLRRERSEHGCATLDIVGDGPLRRDLERLADQLGLGRAVRFCGDVDHASLPAVYRSAGAFALSSRHEAQSMVALEAAACGVPIAGTRVGVVPELTASVVPVGDHAALTGCLASVLGTPPTSDTVGLVCSDFALGPCTARFRDLYTAVASEGA
jgi:glycosyltransferase involved in cell wall biosynthesis